MKTRYFIANDRSGFVKMIYDKNNRCRKKELFNIDGSLYLSNINYLSISYFKTNKWKEIPARELFLII